MVETIEHEGKLLSIIVRAGFDQPGIAFFTSNELSQQLAHMHHPVGKRIDPHVHNPVQRQVTYTQEVLFIKQGKLRVDFYCSDQRYLYSKVLGAGDVILLATGGHGFEVLEELQMIEVKQGPYFGDQDKTRFQAATAEAIRIVDAKPEKA